MHTTAAALSCVGCSLGAFIFTGYSEDRGAVGFVIWMQHVLHTSFCLWSCQLLNCVLKEELKRVDQA